MKTYQKYSKGFFMPPVDCYDWVKKDAVDKAPIWCSVDLRDGNQALITPMSLEDKIEFFKVLVKVGFKQIEIGFPAASETEYEFARTLIDNNLIPDDVTIQVLTQAREHIIERTFEALKGAKSAIVHVYNSVSVAQREQVFKKNKDEIKQIAINGAKMLKDYASKTEGNFIFQYSPESFTGTEPEYSLEVVNAVLDIWKPTKDNKCIINLPNTVQMASSHVYACQIEYMCKNMKYRDNVIVSLHPHNDRGCAVADAELGILAGADKIEGTLFGNGERTGNADIINIAMNMHMHGVNPNLDFSNMNELVEVYERVTALPVPPRSPYAGSLVFTAFSGSHQDAIAKGLVFRQDTNPKYWTVPYLPIDPTDVGRNYDKDVIRINSQSGKGGIGYLLEQNYGYILPPKMREDFGYKVKNVSDHAHKELSAVEVFDIFNKEYVNISTPIELIDYSSSKKKGQTEVSLDCVINGKNKTLKGVGNGILDAVNIAIKEEISIEHSDLAYSEHAIGKGSKATAVSYVGFTTNERQNFWGVGVDSDITSASIKALISAVNNAVNNK